MTANQESNAPTKATESPRAAELLHAARGGDQHAFAMLVDASHDEESVARDPAAINPTDGYYSPTRALHGIVWWHAAVLTGAAAVLLAAARMVVERRDLV